MESNVPTIIFLCTIFALEWLVWLGLKHDHSWLNNLQCVWFKNIVGFDDHYKEFIVHLEGYLLS